MRLGFLKNSNFWSVFIAGLALFFSLTPPISQWIKKEELSLLYSNRTFISNYFGILSYAMLIDLRNTGNTDLSNTKMELVITSEGGSQKKYSAETIERYVGSPQPIVTPMTRILIKPGEHWKEVVTFQPHIAPKLELRINELKFKFIDDLNIQQQGLYTQTLKKAPVSLVEQAEQIFNANFDMEQGEYQATLTAFSDKKVLAKKVYKFKIEAFQIAANLAQLNDYKYGLGVYGPANTLKMTYARNSEVLNGD